MANRRVGIAEKTGRRHEVVGAVAIGVGLLVAISLFTYDPRDPSWGAASTTTGYSNLAGPFGAYLSDILFQLIGGGAFAMPFYFVVYGVNSLINKEPRSRRVLRVVGGSAFIVSLSTLLRISWEHLAFGGINAGGLTGELIAVRLMDIFGVLGAYVLTLTVMAVALVISTKFSLIGMFRALMSLLAVFVEKFKTVYLKNYEQRRRLKTQEERDEFPDETPPPEIVEKIVKPAPPTSIDRLQEALPFRGADKAYNLPPLSLLSDPPANRRKVAKDSLIMSSNLLEKKLHDFGVEGKVSQVSPGPVITMYEFEPAPGVKVNKVAALSDDLALAMRAESVRIVAPLPGKAAVGIEIPNNVRDEVFFKEILSSAEFSKAKSPLTIALGKDIYGTPVATDLAKMPHLLVAGATGSGKSVAINTMVMSLMMNARPREMRLLMVDPKRLELSVYDGVPHLLDAVITEPRRAASSLRRVVVVMEERYKLLAAKGVRNIEGFNTKVVGEKAHPRLGQQDAEPPEVGAAQAIANEDGTLPYIVVIIDELADLMMVAAKEVEDSIARLAQMARASGIHLVMATQRPSVDVLTGVIKANFPARISFQVSSKTDSRTILDANGAEALLGKGDMLFLPPGTAKLTRIHGSYVSEEEIEKTVEFLKRQARPRYDLFTSINPPAFEGGKKSSASEGSDEGGRDERYHQAVDIVVSVGKASASLLQRRMRIGYPTASRIIEMMEDDGIIGPKKEGGKEREVLIKH